jgi:hypothetical protein
VKKKNRGPCHSPHCALHALTPPLPPTPVVVDLVGGLYTYVLGLAAWGNMTMAIVRARWPPP